MAETSFLPSLLAFGPHTELPPEEVLEDLRQELINKPRLSALKEAVGELPEFWTSLLDFDPELRQVPGASLLGQLEQWLKNGGPFPRTQGTVPNHYGLAVTVLLQISHYSRYLDHLGKDSHSRILRSVETGGIQGFCAGFLSAVAVASAEVEADLGSAAAVALRLAVCIGAYVDQDGIYSQEPEDFACVAVLWRMGTSDGQAEVSKILQSYPKVRLYPPSS